MERCEQTATLLGFPEAVVDGRLTECDYGEWTGRPLSELSGEPLWATIQDRPSSVTFPAGEAMQAMRDRMVAFMDDLQTRHGDGDLVVLVSHGDPIKAVVSEILGQPFDLFQRIVVGPASVTLVERTAAASTLWFLNGGPEALRHLGSGAPVVGGGDVTGGS